MVVSASPITDNTTSANAQSSSNSDVLAGSQMYTGDGQMSTTHGRSDIQLPINGVEQRRRGRPRRRIKHKPHVTTATCCGSGDDVTMATDCGSDDVAMETDSNVVTRDSESTGTVPCTQQHCDIPALQLRHVGAGIGHAERCVVLEKQHSAITSNSTQQHISRGSTVIAELDQRDSVNDSQQRHSAANTTHLITTTTHRMSTTCHTVNPKDSVSTTYPPVYARDGLTAHPTVMYHGDCTMPMLWLPEQPSFGSHNVADGDDYDDEGRCKMMMSPASFHLIPLLAAPHPYPCIEPMYVDMATVGMATLGVGMPPADVDVAVHDVGMATPSLTVATAGLATAGVGMETAGVATSTTGVGMVTADVAMPMASGLVCAASNGTCMMTVDDTAITRTDPLIWSTLYHCAENCLPTFDLPAIGPASTSTNLNACLVSGPPNIDGYARTYALSSSASPQFKPGSPRATHSAGSLHTNGNVSIILSASCDTHPQSKIAVDAIETAPSGRDADNPSATPTDFADSFQSGCAVTGIGTFLQTAPAQPSSAADKFYPPMMPQDVDDDDDDGDNADGGDLEDGQTSTASRPDVVSSNIPRSHATTAISIISSSGNSSSTTSSSSSGSSSGGSSSSNIQSISGCQLDTSARQFDQPRDCDNADEQCGDENDELLPSAEPSSVDEPVHSIDQHRLASTSSSSLSLPTAGVDVNSCVKSNE